jgi:class 3 adenylate cyclase
MSGSQAPSGLSRTTRASNRGETATSEPGRPADNTGVPPLPTGVVTFLLTDVEGSTRLWEREPDAMHAALAHHDAIVAAGVRLHHGVLVKSRGEGDSIFAVFERTRDAVMAAFAIQRALSDARWATSSPLRVRMAIHTGKVELRERDYYGPTVNRCARLRAVAHGGQVLISGVSAQLVQGQLPPGARLLDLGNHELKDLSTPEHIWQLVHPLLQQSFPPLVTSVSAPPPAEPAPAPDVDAPVLEIGPPNPRRFFMLTDQLNRTPDGRAWREGQTHSVDENVSQEDAFHCYATPKLAALLNAANERMRHPRLWEVQVEDPEVDLSEGEVFATSVTGVQQVPMPSLLAQDFARFAVLCAREAFSAGLLGIEFTSWSRGWLAGQDRSGEEARGLAEALESEAYRLGGGYMHPEMLAAAHAARTAVHAARTAYLGGRARDEETERTAEVAAEALHLASRVAHLDLVGLADQAVPDARLEPVPAAGKTNPRVAWRVA